MRRNILYVETGYGFGGAVICLVALLKGLCRERYIPVVVFSQADNVTRNLLKDINASIFYVKKYRRREWVNRLLERIAKVRMLKNIVLFGLIFVEMICRISLFVKLMEIIKKEKIDIVHINNCFNSNLEAIFASRLLKVPCVAHVRWGVESLFSSRFGAKLIPRFIAISEFVKERLRKLGISDRKIEVVYDGIDVCDCQNKKSNFQGDNFNKYSFEKHNVGLFACIVWWKGHKVFIEAVNILIKEKKLKNCKFFIVGDVVDKKSKLKEELIDLVNKLNLEDYIVFTGHQDNVFPFMDKMDIVVHTSIKPEPFGRVIIEAMALGKPVIATKMGGPLEMIENGVDGILIEPGNPEILAEKILFLLSNRDKRIEIGRNAQITARKKFSIESHVRKIEKIYEEILK